ncbi:E3 ubiquitin-protein ligase ZNF598 [Diachasma alloeum]|uniref:E3 ubiquitin-protein ligase ZNF598 n=1 Tax=Diachasma alloeum TaxID=454923 RepID=UPI00073824BD|nr:E3 ubiquitin-protein ligase ZNF598 [Diachasma alloeum]
MSDIRSTTNSAANTNNGACIVCYKNVDLYSIGMCEHPVCYECSTRMRVLCKQNECPICRQELPKVVFTREIKPFRHIHRGNLLDTRYNIYFENPEIQEKFTELLAHSCNICEERQVFSSFNSLKEHMRRQHELHYCDLCVENLKIFSCERRCYSRADLAHHRRKGDTDDKSHKGHPLCEFCDRRYMDNDELFRHLRRDHLYCHFCDADGLHQYYSSYDYLRDHFRQEHYLCEEGACSEEKFTPVFRTDIDLKAHKASVHGKHLGKAAAKQARTLELEFTLAPRGDPRNSRRGPQMGPGSSQRDYAPRNRDYVDQRDFHDPDPPSCDPEAPFMRQPDVQSTEEFPSLGNTPLPPDPHQTKSKGRGNLTIRNSFVQRPLAVTDENFPALGPDSTPNSVSKTVNLSVYSSNRAQPSSSTGPQRPQSSAPNVSIQVNHKTDGSITTRVSGPTVRIRPSTFSRDSDFPALGRNEATSTSNSAQWTKVTCVKPSSSSSKKKVAPAPVLDPPPASLSTVSCSEAFPSLPKSSKAKKSSISVVTNDSSSYASTWNRSSVVNENESNSTDANKVNTKKKKKKKVKQTSSGNNSSGNESTAQSVQSVRDKPSEVANSQSSGLMSARVESQDRKKSDSSPEPSANPNPLENETKVSTNGIRKRSELKIDSLNNTNNVRRTLEDFPALGKTSKTRAGNPPPGFNTTTPPPPGFAVKLNSTEQPRTDNGLTFTNSSGESFSILPDNGDKSYSYVPPLDFPRRNKNLVARIGEVLESQKESMEEFRHFSGLFRRGTLSGEHYYKRCRSAMGADAFRDVFPEMLVLLPDVAKQRELFDLHKKEVGGVKTLDVCSTCGQVVKTGSDFKAHLSSHTLDSHFPALGEATNVMGGNTCFRRGA